MDIKKFKYISIAVSILSCVVAAIFFHRYYLDYTSVNLGRVSGSIEKLACKDKGTMKVYYKIKGDDVLYFSYHAGHPKENCAGIYYEQLKSADEVVLEVSGREVMGVLSEGRTLLDHADHLNLRRKRWIEHGSFFAFISIISLLVGLFKRK